MSAARRGAAVVTVAAGLALAALTDATIVAAGGGTFRGVPLGLLAAPLLLLAAVPSVRDAVRAEPARALVLLGAAWTLAPLVDQHLLRVVAVQGLALDVVHHVAGWLPLLAGSQRLSRPRPLTTR
jgi:hypothetical protein